MSGIQFNNFGEYYTVFTGDWRWSSIPLLVGMGGVGFVQVGLEGTTALGNALQLLGFNGYSVHGLARIYSAVLQISAYHLPTPLTHVHTPQTRSKTQQTSQVHPREIKSTFESSNVMEENVSPL